MVAMPHSPQEKKKVLTRLSRIRGQTEALERAVAAGTECGALLQQIAALRGAANGLMADVLESHLRETFAQSAGDAAAKDMPSSGPLAEGRPDDAQVVSPPASASMDAQVSEPAQPPALVTPIDAHGEIEQIMRIIRTYLK